jgi:putative transposase
MARAGEQTFDVSPVRGGGFYPSALEKGTRTERALNLALAEMYVQGVSPLTDTDCRLRRQPLLRTAILHLVRGRH